MPALSPPLPVGRNCLEQVVAVCGVMTVSVNVVPVAWMRVKKEKSLLVGMGYRTAEDVVR